MVVHPGLCRTWSETPKTGFLTTRLILFATYLIPQRGHRAIEQSDSSNLKSEKYEPTSNLTSHDIKVLIDKKQWKVSNCGKTACILN